MDLSPMLLTSTFYLLIHLAFLSLPVFPLSEFKAPNDPHPLHTDSNTDLFFQLEDMKLKISQLEATLEEHTRSLNTKDLYLEEKEKQIEELTHKILLLQNSLLDLKQFGTEPASSLERVDKLEEEVRLLWEDSRKKNFDLHILDAKALDTKEKLEVLNSQVQKMADIVTEQWIQIQQLEQALQITEARVLKARSKAGYSQYTFLKLVNDFHGRHLQKLIGLLDSKLYKKEFILKSYISHAFSQLRKIALVAQKYHHELQGSIKRVMEKNEITAALAHEELVFLVASALITFPLMSAWIMYTSCFN